MELILEEGLICGSKYYTAYPSFDWVLNNKKSNQYWILMEDWCIDTFGRSGTDDMPGVWTPNARWYINSAKFWFRDKKDLEWFILKWQ